jgi:hypothetical protein
MALKIRENSKGTDLSRWDNGLCISKVPKGRGSQLDVGNLMMCLFVQDTAGDFDLRWRHAELEQKDPQGAHALRRAEYNRPDPIFGSSDTDSIVCGLGNGCRIVRPLYVEGNRRLSGWVT